MGDGLNRRELLKRGAIAGGALWASPMMHAVGIAQVDSEDTSPLCRFTITINDVECDPDGSSASRTADVCPSGCVCAGGIYLVVEGIAEFSIPADSCSSLRLTGPPGTSIIFWLECRDGDDMVVAESTHETLFLGPCIAPASTASATEGLSEIWLNGVRVATR